VTKGAIWFPMPYFIVKPLIFTFIFKVNVMYHH